MIPISITLRSANKVTPPFETSGFVPFPTSPLAVAHGTVRSGGKWTHSDKWRIYHLLTGWHLGPAEWDSAELAMSILVRCNLSFPAWPLATGKPDDPATKACHYWFKAALNGG